MTDYMKKTISFAGSLCSFFFLGYFIYMHDLFQALPWGLLSVYQLADALG